MSTFIIGRDRTYDHREVEQRTVRADDLIDLNIRLGTHGPRDLWGTFRHGASNSTRELVLASFDVGHPRWNLAELLLPYLQNCVMHAISLEVPVIDHLFFGLCLTAYDNDVGSMLEPRQVVRRVTREQRQQESPVIEISRGQFLVWDQITEIVVVDGAQTLRDLRARLEAERQVLSALRTGTPPVARPDPAPEWFVMIKGVGHEDTWKIGNSVTHEGRAHAWAVWWLDRRGTDVHWAHWWAAFDRICGGVVTPRLDGHVEAQASAAEDLRHLDLGAGHVGANDGRAVVQHGSAAADGMRTAVPSQGLAADADDAAV